MIKLVVDASVSVKWFVRDSLEEEDVEPAVDLLIGVGKNHIELIQPPHWMAEIVAVLSRLQPHLVDEATDLLDIMQIPTVSDGNVYKLASHLAILVTADQRYFRKSKQRGSICLLSEFRFDT